MKEHAGASSYKNKRNCVVTIGTFDGVHLGHRAILERLVAAAKVEDMDSVLLTFFPHPRMVLQKESGIKLLNTLEEKKQLLEEIGIDHLVIHPFTAAFSRLGAMEYVRDILVNTLKAKRIIIGYDHRFGRNRAATIDDLKDFGRTYEFEVEEISAREVDQVAISSTKIRAALERGDISTANQYLGYPYLLSGKISRGKGLGRTMNYPTANLEIIEPYKLIPKNGVYVVFSEIDNELVYGITSIGTNPTLGDNERTIETYFLDFEGDLYDLQLRIAFITHIRDEETFDNLDELKVAIRKDEEFARLFIANLE